MMKGKRVTIVTGAAGGLGASVTRRLLDRGDFIWAVVTSEAKASALASQFAAESLTVRVADLTDSRQVDSLFAEWDDFEAESRSVVHLVGGFRYGRLMDLADDDWHDLVNLNLETTFRVLRATERSFEKAGGGSLVAVSAPAALEGRSALGGYSATKAGVLRLVEAAAREMKPFGARANAILPGTMDTPGNRKATPDSDPSNWVPTADVSAVIEFLTSENARSVNGSAIFVPGPTL